MTKNYMQSDFFKKEFIIYAKYIVLLLSVVVVFCFVNLSLYCNPSADDFCYAAAPITPSFIDSQLHWYNYQNGRYFSTLLLTFNPMRYLSFTIYKLIPIGLISCFFIGFYYLIKMILGSNTKPLTLIVSTFSLLALYFGLIENVSQSIYWASASFTYQVPAVLLVLFLVSLDKRKDSFKVNKVWWLVLNSLFVISIVGCHELPLLTVNLLLGLIICVDYLRNKKIGFDLLVLLAISVLFSLIVYLAPSNSIREASSVAATDLSTSIHDSVYYLGESVEEWLMSGYLFVSLILFFLIVTNAIEVKEHYFNYIHPIVTVVLIFICLVLLTFPTFYFLGNFPPPRTMNFVYFMFVFSWVYFTINFSVWIKPYYDRLSDITSKYCIRSCFSLIIVLFLMSAMNIKDASFFMVLDDLTSQKAREYDKEFTRNRYQIVKSKSEYLKVDQIRVKPQSLFFSDIDGDGYEYQNPCFSQVFNKKTISWY